MTFSQPTEPTTRTSTRTHSANISLPICPRRMQLPSLLFLKALPVSYHSTATHMATYRYRSSRPRSCSQRCARLSLQSGRRKASMLVSLLLSTTSSVTRDVALLHPTSTPTTAMHSEQVLHSSSPMARLATWPS